MSKSECHFAVRRDCVAPLNVEARCARCGREFGLCQKHAGETYSGALGLASHRRRGPCRVEADHGWDPVLLGA